MASSSSFLSEDQLLCPICLGVFVEPVSTPCGHNFCKSCLSSHWDSSLVCFCPVCKESFSLRPQLRVNTLISGLSQSFSSLQLRPEPHTSVLEQADRKAQLGVNEAKISSLIQERVQRVCSIRETKAQRHEETRRVITQSEEVLQDVLKKVQRSHKDLVQKVEEMQQQEDSEAEALVLQTEQEIADLIETQTKLQDLKETEDPFIFLQKHPNKLICLSSQPIHSLKEELVEMRESLESCTSRIKECLERLDQEICESEERQNVKNPFQKYAINLRLDPDTAHPQLLLSPDLKQVWFNRKGPQAHGNNSKRFLGSYTVVTDRGFASGRFYFEVFVGQKEEWALGLIAESTPRAKAIPKVANSGIWALYFRVNKFYTFYNRNVPVYRGKVERVGVFVDCENGQVSFYDVKTSKCIYSFNDYISEEKMFPFLNPCNDEFPSNLGPMMIVDCK